MTLMPIHVGKLNGLTSLLLAGTKFSTSVDAEHKCYSFSESASYAY
jgi:hypothetical protein